MPDHARVAESPQEHHGVEAAVVKAIELIADGTHIGLGSGQAASLFIARLGTRVRQGLRVTGVATSQTSAERARSAGIPLIELVENIQLDITVDGADEVAPNLDLVKGRGGALVRERIVAAASRSQVIIVGAQKLVRQLGERGPVPVEVNPFGQWVALKEIKALGLMPSLRLGNTGSPFITDNGNFTFDCGLPRPLRDPSAARDLEAALLTIPGVIDTGLFLGTAELILVGYGDGRVDTLRRAD